MFHRRRRRYRYCDRMGNCISWIGTAFNPPRTGRSNTFGVSDGTHRPDRRDNNLFLVDSRSLIVRDIDFLIEKNSWTHNTNKFALSKNNDKLIVRRGSVFNIKIKFQKKINRNDDIINFVFTLKDAPHPSYAQNTRITIPVIIDERSSYVESLLEDNWNAHAIDIDDNFATIGVSSSADAIIGEWILTIDTKSQIYGNSSLQSYSAKDPIIILFNPWNKKDTVYMKEKDTRYEYVLNDSGIIWRGTHDRLKPTPWNFAQHEENILEACLYALSHIGRFNVVDRGDPIKVTRHITAIVNNVDDNGIVVGNWKGDFSGGTAPTAWHGSLAILQQYYKTKKPVKFGQCWVFSGVLNTITRCIGIPSRVITCYQSAHDTHSSLTIDRFFDHEGEPIKEYNLDSIWNFHTWNEVWMRRPDLSFSGAYDGWQIVDATPQEASDGFYRCGPASVEAIKQGEVNRPYDGKFVYSEVNADEVFWLHQGPKQPMKFISHDSQSIGQKLSTKAVSNNNRVDLTDDYKHEEGSLEERQIMIKALRMTKSQFSRYYLNEQFEDIKFEFLLLDDIVVGKPFTVRLKMYNKSDKVYTVQCIINIRTTLYNGVMKSIVKKERNEVKVGPKSEEEIIVGVSYAEYEKHLWDQSIFHITVMANVEETEFQYYAIDDFRVRMPDIIIQTEGDLIEGRPFTCHVFFVNPLPKPLTKGIFTIEGPDLSQGFRLPLKKSVLPDEEARTSFVITPKVPGKKTITAKFSSPELSDVDGYKTIRISPNIPTNFNNNFID